MSERRILSEDEVLRLMAHFFAVADLHVYEGPYYTDRRILEGMLPLIDALIRDGDPATSAWLEAFQSDAQKALAVRGGDQSAYKDFLHHAPGRIAREIRRRRAG